jgi:hypothetical protein
MTGVESLASVGVGGAHAVERNSAAAVRNVRVEVMRRTLAHRDEVGSF